MLQEYGRAAILTTYVEFFLKEVIKRKGAKIKGQTLGALVKSAKNYLPIKLVGSLDRLNKERKKLIHGTVGSTQSSKTGREWHFIQKDGEEFPIGIKFIKKYCEQARNIITKLITLK